MVPDFCKPIPFIRTCDTFPSVCLAGSLVPERTGPMPENKLAYLKVLSFNDRGKITLKFVAKDSDVPNAVATQLAEFATTDDRGKETKLYNVPAGLTKASRDLQADYPYSADLTAEMASVAGKEKKKSKKR